MIEPGKARGLNKPFVHVHGNVYMVVYTGLTVPSMIKTYTILPDGTIMGMIDELIISCYNPSIIQVSQNIFAIATRTGGNNVLDTYEISDDGIITGLVDSLTLRASAMFEAPTIFMVTDTVYGYFHGSVAGQIDTIGISADGTINGVIDTNFIGVVVTPGYGFHVAGDVFAVIGQGVLLSRPEVSTVEILPDGTINGLIDNFFSGYQTWDTHAIRMNKNMYATAGQDSGGEIVVHTIEIADDGIIAGEIDAWVGLGYDPVNTNVFTPFLTRVGMDVYGISYHLYRYVPDPEGDFYEGHTVLVKLSENGMIDKHIIDDMVFSNIGGYEPSVIQVSNRIYAITYEDVLNYHVYIETFDICDMGGRIRFTAGLTHRPM